MWFFITWIILFVVMLVGSFSTPSADVGQTIQNVGMSLVGSLLFMLLFYLYFLPYHNAKKSGHKQKDAILILNLFLGWTFIGWVAALIWSSTKSS